MENYNMIIAGVIGSAITLLLTAVIDYLKEKYRAKIEIQKNVFQRKLMQQKMRYLGFKKAWIVIA